MPEKKEVKVLSGETSITPSSDEHVQDLYQGWHDQVYGIGNTTDGHEIVEGEIFSPESVTPKHDEPASAVSLIPTHVTKLTPGHSALGKSIFGKRQRQLKLAA